MHDSTTDNYGVPPEWVDPLTQTISVFTGAHGVQVVEILTLGAMLERIRTGHYRTEIATLRANRPTLSKKAYTTAKEQLPAFTPCCLLMSRERDVAWDEKFVQASGVVQIDYDDVPDADALKQRLATHPSVVFAFTSPSRGVKVGIAAAGIVDRDSYAHAWRWITTVFAERYPELTASTDEHVKYLHALCFVSDDPDLYVNPTSALY
jgi:VirE N-terminal domain